MTLGIVMKGCNEAYKGRWIDFFFEFLPQLVLFMCLFGFMDFLVLAKWLKYYEDTSTAPGIIILMLDMAFFKTEPSEPNFAPIIGTLEEQT